MSTIGSVMIETLSQRKMAFFLERIVALDKVYIEQMGASFCTFPWNGDNYLLELEGKWDLSQFAHTEDSVVGIWVASNTVKSVCHTHRVLVSPQYQGQGMAKALFECVRKKAHQKGLLEMTIEVSRLNPVAKQFYEKLGFELMEPPAIERYLASRGRKAKVFEGYIEERDSSQYYVCRRTVG